MREADDTTARPDDTAVTHADDAGDETPREPKPTRVKPKDSDIASGIITLAIAAVILMSALDGWQLLATYWRYAVWGVLAVAAVPLFLLVRYWVRRASATKRAGIIVFVAVPIAIAGFFAALPFVAPDYQVIILRSVFLALVILIPPALYYLFIATRRETLLNAYLSNLYRLGLLWPRRVNLGTGPSVSGEELERESSRRRRVRSYFERFEAVYGRLPDKYVDDILESTAPSATGREDIDPAHHVWTITFALQTMLPVVAATVLIALGWLLVLPLRFQDTPATDQAAWFAAFIPEQSPVNFAFLGAYFFSLQMLVRRFVRRDLGPNAFVAISLRIILAMIATWVAGHLLVFFTSGSSLSDDTKLTIAFAIGAFPLIVWQLIAGMFKRLPFINFALPSLKTTMPLSELDGLSVWHESRLEEEDIENIPNMASADIVELMLCTKFPPHRIIDWVDQSILYTAANSDDDKDSDDRRRQLQKYGIRTASALVEAMRAGTSDINGIGVAANEPAGASKVRNLADALSTSPNLPLVLTWKGLPPIARKERTAAAAE